MIEITTNQFAQNPDYYQTLAQKEPVLVASDTHKQILLDYEEPKHLTDKPFVSLYDALFASMSPQLRQTLAQMSDDELRG